MAINSYQAPKSALPELLAVVDTLGKLGVISTPDSKYKDEAAREAKLKSDQMEAQSNVGSNASKLNARGLISIVNQKVSAGAMSPQDGRLMISSIMDEAGNPAVSAADIEAFQKNMSHGDPTNTIITAKKSADNALLKAQIAQTKKLPADKVVSVTEGSNVINQLGSLNDVIDQNEGIFGPVAGRFYGNNPWDEQAKTLDAQLRTASQTVGKYMEGGVLRKEDEEKYRKMLPQLSDTPDVAKNKLQLVSKMLTDKYNADSGALSKSGYDTGGLPQVPASPSLPKVLSGNKSAKLLPHMSDEEVAAAYQKLKLGGK